LDHPVVILLIVFSSDELSTSVALSPLIPLAHELLRLAGSAVVVFWEADLCCLLLVLSLVGPMAVALAVSLVGVHLLLLLLA
jgi:hypothetical protein